MSDHQGSRPPVDAASVRAGDRWRVEVVETSGSTNADVAARFAAGEREGLVLVAEDQTAGRGRLGRSWVAPPRSSLTVSFLVVPPAALDPARWSWLPLLTGLAAAAAVRRVTGVEVGLKWPNDVLVAQSEAQPEGPSEDPSQDQGGLKLGGILLERVEREGVAAAVVGVGLNCTQDADELPVPQATSLALAGAPDVDRAALLAALAEELGGQLDAWVEGADLRPAYVERCVTLGQQVRVSVPGGDVLGEAVDIDADGRLVVRTAGGTEHLGAGDVVHVRPS